MTIMERYEHGELSPDVAKVKQGSVAGDSNDKPGKKDKVNPAIFKMAEQRDY